MRLITFPVGVQSVKSKKSDLFRYKIVNTDIIKLFDVARKDAVTNTKPASRAQVDKLGYVLLLPVEPQLKSPCDMALEWRPQDTASSATATLKIKSSKVTHEQIQSGPTYFC